MKQLLCLCVAVLTCLTVTSTSQAQSSTVSPLNGIVAWLSFNETAGTVAQDASGMARHGTVVKSVPSTDAATWQGGKLRLSRTQYVSIPLNWQPSCYTVSWWVKADSRADWTQAIRAEPPGADTWGAFLFHTAGDGRIYVGTDVATWLALPAGTFQLRVWQHFAFTFDNGEARLYKNGVLLASRPNMNMPQAWQRLTIGSDSPMLMADGQYEDFRLYNRALSNSEVNQLQSIPPVAYLPPALPSEDLDYNWSFVRSFDGQGNIVGEEKNFSDALGLRWSR